MAEEKLRSSFAWALVAVLVTASIMLFVSFQLGFFLLIFATIGWWVWKNPEEGILLFLVLAPLLSLFKATQTIGSVTLIKDVIILVLFARVFLWPLLTKKLPYRRSILFGPAAALVMWTSFETLRADSLTLGILRAREIILYLLLYFAVLYLPTDIKIWKRRLTWFTASFLLTTLHAAYQWLFAGDSAVLRFDPGRQIWIPRISSTFGHPSVYGEYLVAAATLFFALVLQLRRAFYSALFLISLFLIYFTYSRAVWIGFAAAIGVMGAAWAFQHLGGGGSSRFLRGGDGFRTSLRHPRGISFAATSGVLAVILIFVLLQFTPAGSLLRSAFDPTYKSNQERLEFLARLIAPMSNVEAILGRGLGDVTQQNFRSVDIGSEEIATGAAREVQLAKNRTLVDNQYLKTFVEMGLIGLVIYFWLFWRFARAAWPTNVHLRSGQLVIGYWALGFLAAFIVQALFIDIWDIFPTNAMFWITGGLLGAALTPYTKTT